MGSEAEEWQNSEVPKLPLLAITAVPSPDRSGMLTPPIHISASVPFHWEEKPGLPRFAFTNPQISIHNESTWKKGLELPPRLLSMEAKIPKVPPSIELLGRERGQSCSFHKELLSGSFRFEKKQLGAMVLSDRGSGMEKEWFGWLRKRGFRSRMELGCACGSVFLSYERENGNFAESSSCSRMKLARTIPTKGSFSCLSHPNTHFWGNLHEGLKQIINIPWKTKKHQKQ